jgi:hypothetical protein
MIQPDHSEDFEIDLPHNMRIEGTVAFEAVTDEDNPYFNFGLDNVKVDVWFTPEGTPITSEPEFFKVLLKVWEHEITTAIDDYLDKHCSHWLDKDENLHDGHSEN